jgi:hypothetical protein
MKFKKSIVDLNLGFIPSTVLFIYGFENHAKFLKKNKVEVTEDVSKLAGFVEELEAEEGHVLLVVVDSDDLGVLVHELSHAVTAIMEHYGFDCDEFRSYLLESLFVGLMPFYEMVQKDGIEDKRVSEDGAPVMGFDPQKKG